MKWKLDVKDITLLEILEYLAISLPIFGIVFAVMSVENWWNYNNIPVFFIITGFSGLAIGSILNILIIRFKPKMFLNFKHRRRLWILFSPFLVGVLMYLVSYYNNASVSNDEFHRYTVVKKIHKDYRYRSNPERNILIVNIDGNNRKINCRYNYWIRIKTGQKVPICFQEGYLGFDYISIVDHYW